MCLKDFINQALLGEYSGSTLLEILLTGRKQKRPVLGMLIFVNPWLLHVGIFGGNEGRLLRRIKSSTYCVFHQCIDIKLYPGRNKKSNTEN
jgi:hypothetical protein